MRCEWPLQHINFRFEHVYLTFFFMFADINLNTLATMRFMEFQAHQLVTLHQGWRAFSRLNSHFCKYGLFISLVFWWCCWRWAPAPNGGSLLDYSREGFTSSSNRGGGERYKSKWGVWRKSISTRFFRLVEWAVIHLYACVWRLQVVASVHMHEDITSV